MLFIILVERKYFFIKINSYYFSSPPYQTDSVDLNGYSHSFFSDGLLSIDTIHIDLTATEEQLFSALRSTNRKQIKKAKTRDFIIEVNCHPSKNDIRAFQLFYNVFARKKKTYLCNTFHVDTMNRLAEKKALVITTIKNSSGEILSYRIYVTDGTTVMSLYSASHYKENTEPLERRLLSEANRYLLWHNILYFKSLNHTIYDMGGLTDNKNIQSFKMEFGGEVKQVYSGYKPNSRKGKLVLWLRKITMRKG